MGRPKYKDIDKVKNKFIHIRFTEKELYLLKSAAKKKGYLLAIWYVLH